MILCITSTKFDNFYDVTTLKIRDVEGIGPLGGIEGYNGEIFQFFIVGINFVCCNVKNRF